MPEQSLCPQCAMPIEMEYENYVVLNKDTYPDDSGEWELRTLRVLQEHLSRMMATRPSL